MSLYKIEQLASRLNYEWYNEKKSFFSKEPFYDPKEGKISDTIPNSVTFEDENSEEFSVDQPYVYDVDFNNYCWRGFYCNLISITEEEYEDYPIDASDISKQIIFNIRDLVNSLKNDDETYNVITISKETLTEKIEKMQMLNPDNIEYKEVLKFFLDKTITAIDMEFNQFLSAYVASKKYKDKLVFNLNQEEIAALLNILFKADFFYQPYGAEYMFLDFGSKYFHFPNQRKNGQITPAKGLYKKFSEARGESCSIKAQNAVKQRLYQVLKDL